MNYEKRTGRKLFPDFGGDFCERGIFSIISWVLNVFQTKQILKRK